MLAGNYSEGTALRGGDFSDGTTRRWGDWANEATLAKGRLEQTYRN